MHRDNKFNDKIVESILSLGFINYNPYTRNELLGRFHIQLDFEEERPIDSISVDEFISEIELRKDELYSKFFKSKKYQKIFAYDIQATDSVYSFYLWLITDDESIADDLSDIAVDIFDCDEED
jgi:hypothetical protein